MTDMQPLLALLDSDPAAGILAAADLREQRTKAFPDRMAHAVAIRYSFGVREHIAAEANPAHVLAAVRRWRGVVERHVAQDGMFPPRCRSCPQGYDNDEDAEFYTAYPCLDLTETADEARAYLGGGS